MDGSDGNAMEDERLVDLVSVAFPDPIIVIDAEAALVWANAAAERRFGWSLSALSGESLAPLVHPDDLETALFSLTSVQQKVAGTVIELRVRDHTGQYSRFEIRGAPLAGKGGQELVVLSLRESTDRRRWEIGSGDTDLLRGVLDASDAITMLLTADGVIRGAHRGLTRLLHVPLEGTIGRQLVDLVTPSDKPMVEAEVALAAASPGRRAFEARLARPDGTNVPLALSIVNLLEDRAVTGLVVSGADISALVEARDRLQHLATHDDLTGLPNRAALRDRLQQLLAAGAGSRYTLVFADMDNLKWINDTFGHHAGDVALHAAAERLRGVVRPDDVVCRVSGDEFAMIVATADPGLLEALERRIDDVMREPIQLPNAITIVTSITTGGAPLDAYHDADDALAAADRAMYMNKWNQRRARRS